jgi:DNA polymerase III alpha subunit (gram-positive type)
LKRLIAVVLSAAMICTPISALAAPSQSDVEQSKQQLAQTTQQLKSIQSQIDQANEELTINKSLLPQKEAEYKAAKKLMAKRIRAMYMMGQSSAIEYIFSAKSFSQMLSNAASVRYVYTSDNQILSKAEEAKKSLEESTKSIEENQKKLQQQEAEITKLQQTQQGQLNQQLTELAAQASSAGTYTVSADVNGIASSNSPKLEKFIQIMVALCNDNSHGYSQSNRWGPDFDCSSSIIYSLRMAGFSINANSTHDLGQALASAGWVQVSSPSRGDIELDPSSHVEMSLGGNMAAGFHTNRGHPETGDQTGTEASVGKNWRSYPQYWHYAGQ